jgi:hypothetical protein
MESFVETWKTMKKKRNMEIMMKELKIETLKRKSLSENESLSVYIQMHPRK